MNLSAQNSLVNFPNWITIRSGKGVHRGVSVSTAGSVFIVEHQKRMARWLIVVSLASALFVGVLAYFLVPQPPEPSSVDPNATAQTSNPSR